MSTTHVQNPYAPKQLSEKALRMLAAHDRQVQQHQQARAGQQWA